MSDHKQGRTIINEKLNKIKRVQRKLSQKLGGIHTSTEITHPVSLEPNQLREFLLLAHETISLDIRVGLEKDTQLQNLREDCRYSDNSYTTVESLDHHI